MRLAATYTDIPWNQSGPVLYRGQMGECFSMIRSDGFDGVEMHIHDSEAEDPDAIQRALSQSGLVLTSIGTGTAYTRDGLSLTSPDPEIRRGAVWRMRGHIRLASRFPGAAVILGLVRGKAAQCPSREQYFALLAASLEDLAAYAGPRGVPLVLEMINRSECDALCSVREGIAFLDSLSLPGLGLHLDTYHMSREEGDAPAAVREAGGRVGHVHLADDDRWFPGHGGFDFSSFLGALREISYQGALAVEALPLPDMRAAGRGSVGRIRGEEQI